MCSSDLAEVNKPGSEKTGQQNSALKLGEMVMDERSKVGQHPHHLRQQQRGDDVGVGGDLGLQEDLTHVEGTSSIEGSPPPSTNGTIVGDGPTNGPPANVYLIGLEFVRQYYTVLHQGPLYLHRFYSEDSSFVHDDSKAVYGQGNIRERIQQLNFCNCVAKILQVNGQGLNLEIGRASCRERV